MNMRIKVTKKDIAHGLRRKAQYCPVARAIKRELSKYGNYKTVIVTPLYIVACGLYPTPVEAAKWIMKYDKRPSKAKPFTFNLNVPEIDKYLK
jgi:hypothetical protein